ncbi:hypothetical protein [Oricola sp.]|uniref:hypothetical protein n=1 Tax=Oricola sp. TaxID=1979950 RepID=UPI003BAD5062
MIAGFARLVLTGAVLWAATPAGAYTKNKGGMAVQQSTPPPPPVPVTPPERKAGDKRPPVASPPSTPRDKKRPNLRAGGPDASIEVTFFDIGQGSCAMVTCPRDGPVPDGPGGGRYAPILIDCGTSAAAATADVDFVRDTLAEAVNRPGSGRPRLVVSHPDTDHYNMIAQVMAGESQPRAAWLGGNWGPTRHRPLSSNGSRALPRPAVIITCIAVFPKTASIAAPPTRSASSAPARCCNAAPHGCPC